MLNDPASRASTTPFRIPRPMSESILATEGREQQIQADIDERLRSIRRCIPHMADVGGIWPRDVEFLCNLVDSLRSDLREAKEDSRRIDWMERGANIDNLTQFAGDDQRFAAYALPHTKPIARTETLRAAIDAARNLTPEKASVKPSSLDDHHGY